MKVGFIGLGIMGRPMAGHLPKGGHALFLYDLGPPPRGPDRARVPGAARRAGKWRRTADVIITMVPDTPARGGGAVRQRRRRRGPVARQDRGRHELDLADRRPRSSPSASTRRAATTWMRRSPAARWAPRHASLSIMVGGPQAAFDKVKPLFELMGKNITLVGGNGDGQTAKVANQIIVALTIEAVAEALLFASKAGADPAKVRAGADGRLRQLPHPRSARRADDQAQLRSRLPHRAAPEGPQPRAAGRAQAAAVSACPTPPPARSCSTPARRMAASAWDHSGMVRALEIMANYEIGGGKSRCCRARRIGRLRPDPYRAGGVQRTGPSGPAEQPQRQRCRWPPQSPRRCLARSFFKSLFGQVVVALILGIALGGVWPDFARGAEAAGRRVHQADQDGHRAARLLRGRARHRRRRRPEEGRPGRRQGGRLFRGPHDASRC